ncbi:hypothetical protein ACFL0O_09625 [Thermodesulfobacteriota bacterium]
MTRLNLLDQIFYMEPGPFLAKYGPWIFLFLAAAIFVSIADLALRSHFENTKARRVLIGSVGTALTLLSYYSIHKGMIEINTTGIAIYAMLLIFFIFFFIFFSIVRALTKKGEETKDTFSFMIAYLVTYIAAWGIAPDFFKQLADISPPANGFLALIAALSFLILLIISFGFFHGNMPNLPGPLRKAAHGLKQRITTADTVEIDKEIREDKKEIKLLKHKTFGLTKKEMGTVDDIDDEVDHIKRALKNHKDHLTDEDKKEITTSLQKIKEYEQVLYRFHDLIEKHETAYHGKHKRDIWKLSQRLKEAQNPKTQQDLKEELTYQKRMIQALEYFNEYRSPIVKLVRSFNRFLATAIERIRTNYINDAIRNLEHAHKNLYDLKHMYAQQKGLEKYLMKMDHKLIKDLKQEKKAA